MVKLAENPLTIFLSSAIEGYEDKRHKIEEACKAAFSSCRVWRFEKTPASSMTAEEFYLRYVGESDILLLLLGPSRGGVKQECQHAHQTGKPILILWEEEHKEELNKPLIRNLGVKWHPTPLDFEDIENLSREIAIALHDEIIRGYKRGQISSQRFEAIRNQRAILAATTDIQETVKELDTQLRRLGQFPLASDRPIFAMQISDLNIFVSEQRALAEAREQLLTEMFEHAKTYRNHREWAKAKEHLEKFLSEPEAPRHPKYFSALNNLGAVHMDMGDAAGAIGWFERAIAAKPNDDLAVANLGTALCLAGRTREAEQKLKLAVELNPSNANAYNSLALVRQESGEDPDRCIELLRKAIEIDSECAQAHANLGFAMSKKCIFGEAETEAKRALEIEPDNPEYEAVLGAVHVRKVWSTINVIDTTAGAEIKFFRIRPLEELRDSRLLDQAILHLESARRRGASQNRVPLMNDLANCYFWKGDLNEAKGILEELTAMDGCPISARQTLGDTYSGLGEYDLALAQYDQVIKRFPDNAAVAHQMAAAYLNKGDLVNAIKYMRKACELLPNDPYFRGNLGLTYFRNEQYSLAAEQFELSLELGSKDPHLFEVLAASYFGAGMWGNANKYFKKYLELGYGHTRFRIAYVNSLFNGKQPDEAIAQGEEILKTESENLEILRLLIQIGNKLGRLGLVAAKARRILEIESKGKNAEFARAILEQVAKKKRRIIEP